MLFNFLKNHFRFEIIKYFSRFSFKATIHFGDLGFSTLILFAKTQRLHGITSLIPNSDNKHIILADIENCTLEQAIKETRFVQQKHGLSHMYIQSDSENSFRIWCFSVVSFKKLLKILLDFEHLDMVFFDYTVRRKKATLRDDKKKDRPPQKIVAVLESYPMPIPEHVQEVFYDTGIVKKGIVISLGDDD